MERKALEEESSKIFETISKEIDESGGGLGIGSDEYDEMVDAVYGKRREEMDANRKEMTSAREELDELIPSSKRKSFVWLYERI